MTDSVRPEAHDVVHDLKHLGFSEVAILTGDRSPAARVVAKRTHIKNVEAELLPADKAVWVRGRQADGRRVAMVGDGINDAPALAAADVGIALGRVGADLAAEAGDMVLLGEPLHVLPDLVRLSRKTVAILRQNILGFAFGLNAVAIGAAFLGLLGPIAAAILHQVGSLLVLLNSMRLLAFGDWANLAPLRWLRSALNTVRLFDDRVELDAAIEWITVRRHAIALTALGSALVTYATSGFTAIGPREVGMLQRQGRYIGLLTPGLHLRLPPPFERITRLEPRRLRGLDIGFRSVGVETMAGPLRWESGHGRDTAARSEEEALLMTGDGRLLELAATVQYRLKPDPEALRRYAFGSADPEAALQPLAESVVRSVVGRQPLESVLARGREEIERAVVRVLQTRIDDYGLGLEVVVVAVLDVHPPLEVVDAFRDVSRAESEKQAKINDGATYRSESVKAAEGQAAATTHAAEADRSEWVARAEGEADAFLLKQSARASSPAVSDRRVFLDLMAAALANRNKILLDPSHDDHRRHLIFPEGPFGPATPAILPDTVRGPFPDGTSREGVAPAEPPIPPG